MVRTTTAFVLFFTQKQVWICSFDIILRCWPQREYVWGASQSLFWTTPKQRIKKQQQNNTSFLHNTRVKTSHSFGLHWHMQIGRRLDFFKTSSASSCRFHHTTFLLHMSSNSGSTSIVFSVFANPVWWAPSASVRSPRHCKRTTTPEQHISDFTCKFTTIFYHDTKKRQYGKRTKTYWI